MEKYKWTEMADKVIFEMITAGASVADICDRLGVKDKQLKNRVARLRGKDPNFPTLGEAKRFALATDESGEIVAKAGGEGSEEQNVALNPLEKEMADIIAENNATIEGLRAELETEKIARGEEAKAYRERIDALVKENREKDQKLVTVYSDLETAIAALNDQREKEADEWATPDEEASLLAGALEKSERELSSALDEVANLSDMLRERDEVIFSMAKAIFLGPQEVILA